MKNHSNGLSILGMSGNVIDKFVLILSDQDWDDKHTLWTTNNSFELFIHTTYSPLLLLLAIVLVMKAISFSP